MTALPVPPTPASTDLRDLPFMPLDVGRLRDSELAGIASAEAFRACVLSWCVAWHQVPAGSLPDDDAVLARLLGFGRNVKSWRRVRAAGGLHGWFRCSDGRLYHPIVAEKVAYAERRREAARERTQSARAVALARRRPGEGAVPAVAAALPPQAAPAFPPLPPDDRAAAAAAARAEVETVDAASPQPSVTDLATEPIGREGEEEKEEPSATGEHRPPVAGGDGSGPPLAPELLRRAALVLPSAELPSGDWRPPAADLALLRARLLAAAAPPDDWPLAAAASLAPLPQLLAEGCDLGRDVLPTVAAVADAARSAAPPRTIAAWSYFAPAIREAHRARLAAGDSAAPAALAAEGGEGAAAAAPRVFVPLNDRRFSALRKRWRTERHREPPTVAGRGGSGWYFDASWLEGEAADALPSSAGGGEGAAGGGAKEHPVGEDGPRPAEPPAAAPPPAGGADAAR
ncbi:MAG: DUF1376 domain-containing protein [Bauldia sp.]